MKQRKGFVNAFNACALAYCLSCALTQTAWAAANARPKIIPSVKQWTAGNGAFTLTANSRIIVRSEALLPIANQMAADIFAIAKVSPAVVVSSSAVPTNADLTLNIDVAAATKGDQGYLLTITSDNGASISGRSYAAVVNGTRSVAQILQQTITTLPVGVINDYPDANERVYMLDVGRKFFPKSYILDTIRILAYYKINTLHLHLNDNMIESSSHPMMQTSYSGFRLSSSNPAFAGLASPDGAYTRADWDEIEAVAATYGVTILPEIDAPAHALAFTKFLKFRQGSYVAGHYDWLDISKPASVTFMKSIFAEFAPWFKSPVIHIGADEYASDTASVNAYVGYIQTMTAYLKTIGKGTRVWGSANFMGFNGKLLDPSKVIVDAWDDGWYSTTQSASDGFSTSNASDYCYMAPVDVSSTSDDHFVYDHCGPYLGVASNLKTSPLLRGATLALWNDNAAIGNVYSTNWVHAYSLPSIIAFAEKNWAKADDAIAGDYASFSTLRQILGVGPGVSSLKNPFAPDYKAGDLAAGKTVSASSSYSGFPAQYATDVNSQSRWAAASAKKSDWITVDLGASYQINEVKLNWEAAYATAYKIQVSSNGSTWTTVASLSRQKGGLADIKFSARNARYVKMQGVSLAMDWGYSLWDFEVYGP